jgi:hypothetical protein
MKWQGKRIRESLEKAEVYSLDNRRGMVYNSIVKK